jgi:hypothetical protein
MIQYAAAMNNSGKVTGVIVEKWKTLKTAERLILLFSIAFSGAILFQVLKVFFGSEPPVGYSTTDGGFSLVGIMFSVMALFNLALAFWRPSWLQPKWRGGVRMSRLSSLLWALSLCSFAVACFAEAVHSRAVRPYAPIGAILVLLIFATQFRDVCVARQKRDTHA